MDVNSGPREENVGRITQQQVLGMKIEPRPPGLPIASPHCTKKDFRTVYPEEPLAPPRKQGHRPDSFPGSPGQPSGMEEVCRASDWSHPDQLPASIPRMLLALGTEHKKRSPLGACRG